MEDKIWATYLDSKFKGFCLDLLISRFQNWERNINIFLAIASSGSIAAWAIWNIVPMLWGTIIACSQILNVIKPYIPYFKYIKELNSKSLRIEILNIDWEKLWDEVYDEKISEKEMSERYYDLKRQMVEIFNFSDEIIFNVNDKLKSKANRQMKIFIKSNYSLDIEI